MTLDKSIKTLLNSKQKNKDNQTYLLFNSANLDRDKEYLENFLISNLKTMSKMVFSEDKKDLAKQILKTIKRLKAIRIDLTDENTPPISLIVQDMKNTHNGQIDQSGAVTLSRYEDGIVLFIPVLLKEIEQNLNTGNRTGEGTHIALHELIHALSVRVKVLEHRHDGRVHRQKIYLTGIREEGKDKGIFDDLNEGMTEYYTQKVLRKRGISFDAEEFYHWRVKLIDAIMNKFEAKERRKIFTQYISGKSDLIIQEFKSLENDKGQNFWDYLEENYQQKHKGISGVNAGPILQQDEDVYNEIVSALEKFEKVNISQVGSIY